MIQRESQRPPEQLAVVLAPMIFHPRRMAGVLVEVLWADVAMQRALEDAGIRLEFDDKARPVGMRIR